MISQLSHNDFLNFFDYNLAQNFHLETPTTNKDYEDCIQSLSQNLKRSLITEDEAFLLVLCLLPNLFPAYLDRVFTDLLGDGNHPQLGGVRGKQHRGILPTGEMALYLMSGEDLELRQALYQEYFTGQHWLFQENILHLEPALPGEPRLSGKLTMSPEYVELFLTGQMGKPAFGIDFPAKEITTPLDWKDLVLHPHTAQQVQDLLAWLAHGQQLLDEWELGRRVKQGYRVLFHGPPGTGKTLTASLLGKFSQRTVYRVDLSMVVSKYIGETEKNLAKLFDKAEHKEWILFFDEADALFGKRTGVRDAHDRYANQEISYLLQRVEDYHGLVILASNLKDNIDEAFLRRFQSIIHFPLPRPGERHRLWKQSFPAMVQLEQSIDLKHLAHQFELSGADIVNVVHFCCLRSMAQNQVILSKELLLEGVYRELQKLGKES